MKSNKNKEGCNGGWITKPRVKIPPNKKHQDQKKKQSKERCRKPIQEND